MALRCRLWPFVIAVMCVAQDAAWSHEFETSRCFEPVLVYDQLDVGYFDMTPFNGRLYFSASAEVGGGTLWSTAGMELDAVEQPLPPGYGLLAIAGATESHLFLFLRPTSDSVVRIELWSLSLTPRRLQYLASNVAYGREYDTEGVAGEFLYFKTLDDELWRSDGTQEGTILLHDFSNALDQIEDQLLQMFRYSIVGRFTPVPSGVVFTGVHPVTGVELWFSDGTEENTVELRNILPEGNSGPIVPREFVSSFPTEFYTDNGTVYFVARGFRNLTTPDGPDLGVYRTDGTDEGTVRLSGPEDSNIVQLGEQLIYSARGSVWSIGLNGADQREFAMFALPDFSGLGPVGLTRIGDRVLLLDRSDTVFGGANNYGRIWSTDGTLGGTNLLHDRSAGFEFSYFWSPLPIFSPVTEKFAVVVGFTLETGRELWLTDGTPRGTRIFRDLRPGAGESIVLNAVRFVVLDGVLYFIAYGGSRGYGLWAADFGAPPVESAHDADTNLDFKLDLPEILRLIQFFNSDGFHVQEGTEDGYAPGPGSTDGAPHDSDYLNQDWQIELSELLRAIQLYNAPVCNYCVMEGTEDGFAV